MTDKHASEDYFVSVTDSDGDQVLVAVPIKAFDYATAWEQATAIALRMCLGSGAMPTSITVVKSHSAERLMDIGKASYLPIT
jgi:hypothetical protein